LAKFTDTAPTEAQFAELIADIQAGIDEHDHTGANAGDGMVLDNTALSSRTRKFFVPAVSDEPFNGLCGYELSPAGTSQAFGYFYVPEDFVSGMSVSALVVVTTAGTGDIYVTLDAYYGAAGEAYSNHSDVTGPTATAGPSVNNRQNAYLSTALSNVAKNDYVRVRFYRQGDDASDTYTQHIFCCGFLVSYTADM